MPDQPEPEYECTTESRFDGQVAYSVHRLVRWGRKVDKKPVRSGVAASAVSAERAVQAIMAEDRATRSFQPVVRTWTV